VHLTRYSLSFCGWKDRQKVANELKAIYGAESAEMAAKAISARIRFLPVGTE
jgi:transposase-like protein